MTKSVVDEYTSTLDGMRSFQQERAIYRVTELLERVLEADGITRSDLAKRLGKSKSWVTQLLDGDGNKTIRTVADVLAALGYEFSAIAHHIKRGTEFNWLGPIKSSTFSPFAPGKQGYSSISRETRIIATPRTPPPIGIKVNRIQLQG